MLNVIDEFTHGALDIWIYWTLKSADVINVLSDLFIFPGFQAKSASIMARGQRQGFTGMDLRCWVEDRYIMPSTRVRMTS
jgi:hypothetical protein